MVILYMVFLVPLTLGAYHKAGYGQLCSDSENRIRDRATCQAAAAALGLDWGNGWWGPNDFPGCLHTRDSRNKVYFNYSPHATNDPSSHPKMANYAEICTGEGEEFEDILYQVQFENQRDIENVNCSTLPEFKKEQSKCSVWHCGKKVIHAIKTCYKKCKKYPADEIGSCIVECAKAILEGAKACWPCIKWACCKLGYKSCCDEMDDATFWGLLLENNKETEITCHPQQTVPYAVSTINDLTQFKAECQQGYVLQGFQLAKATGGFVLQYFCCTIVDDRRFKPFNDSRTPFDPSSQKLNDLTKQDVKCPGNTYFYSFQMHSTTHDSDMWYVSGCASGNVIPACITKNSTQISNDISNLWELAVLCPNELFNRNPYLQQFQMVSSDNLYRYTYTCCGNN